MPSLQTFWSFVFPVSSGSIKCLFAYQLLRRMPSKTTWARSSVYRRERRCSTAAIFRALLSPTLQRTYLSNGLGPFKFPTRIALQMEPSLSLRSDWRCPCSEPPHRASLGLHGDGQEGKTSRFINFPLAFNFVRILTIGRWRTVENDQSRALLIKR
jgi:hypothetical protein